MRERLVRRGAVDYQVARSNAAWSDHRLRTLATGATIAWLQPETVMDPACGDASIVAAAFAVRRFRGAWLADISVPNITNAGARLDVEVAAAKVMPIEEAIAVYPDCDGIVLTEILEHLEDPDAVLRAAKSKATYLVASSPEMRPGQGDTNPEHLWQFDAAGYRQMIERAGWLIEQHTTLRFNSEYDFGIWVAR